MAITGAIVLLVWAQTITVEADATVGRSTQGTTAAAAQVRVFGATASDVRFLAEGVWGRTRGAGSDAFAASYPYDNRLRPMEIFVEKTFRPSAAVILGVRGGRYRTPFGIASRGDHAYAGFTRAPLIRYGENYGLSNTALEAGLDVLAGVPQLTAELSVGRPSDEGETHRLGGLDTVIRLQGYYGNFIVGVSHQRSNINRELAFFAAGKMAFTGIDVRWMRSGVQLRGEWLTGRPFDGVSTVGWYVDASVHRVGMGPVTAVARVERLDYAAGIFSTYPRRLTAGARIRLPHGLTGVVNVMRDTAPVGGRVRAMLDLGVTYSIRRQP